MPIIAVVIVTLLMVQLHHLGLTALVLEGTARKLIETHVTDGDVGVLRS